MRSFAVKRGRGKNPKGKQLDRMGSLREPGNLRNWPVELQILGASEAALRAMPMPPRSELELS